MGLVSAASLNDPTVAANLANPLNTGGANESVGASLLGGTISPEDAGNIIAAAQQGAPTQSNYVNAALNNATSGALSNQNGAGVGLGAQADATRLLALQASGQGPSIANAQMNAGISQAANNANSMAAASRGSGGLGMRNAMNAGAGAASQAAGQGAIARAQEQIGAMNAYGQQASSLSASGIANQNANINAYNAAISGGKGQLAGTMGYDAQKAQYAQNLADTLYGVYNNQAGNTSSSLTGGQAAQAAGQGVGALLGAVGTGIAAAG